MNILQCFINWMNNSHLGFIKHRLTHSSNPCTQRCITRRLKSPTLFGSFKLFISLIEILNVQTCNSTTHQHEFPWHKLIFYWCHTPATTLTILFLHPQNSKIQILGSTFIQLKTKQKYLVSPSLLPSRCLLPKTNHAPLCLLPPLFPWRGGTKTHAELLGLKSASCITGIFIVITRMRSATRVTNQ